LPGPRKPVARDLVLPGDQIGKQGLLRYVVAFPDIKADKGKTSKKQTSENKNRAYYKGKIKMKNPQST